MWLQQALVIQSNPIQIYFSTCQGMGVCVRVCSVLAREMSVVLELLRSTWCLCKCGEAGRPAAHDDAIMSLWLLARPGGLVIYIQACSHQPFRVVSTVSVHLSFSSQVFYTHLLLYICTFTYLLILRSAKHASNSRGTQPADKNVQLVVLKGAEETLGVNAPISLLRHPYCWVSPARACQPGNAMLVVRK